MCADVHKFVSECAVCLQMKDSSLCPTGLLQPLSIPTLVFEDILMDFIIGLPLSRGKATIMVVVDCLSKYGHFISLPSDFSSLTVTSAFVTDIIRLHGIPRSIVMDRNPSFIRDF